MPNSEENVPLSSMVAERGIKTSRDFADFMGALMADVIAGRVDAKTANAACVAGGHMLKIAKMQIDYSGSTEEAVLLSAGNKRLGGEKNPENGGR